MAAQFDGIFDDELREFIRKSKILVVGAGGIGCELLKTLVLTGFETLHLVDLDTIELSNLNRQFLFRKCHIGRSKAEVAKESVLKYNPNVDITTYHDSIMGPKFDVTFFRQFSAVVNALDNISARTHVNRMCLAADVPLLETGSKGYIGNVQIISKGITECYDCVVHKQPKTYAGCTIRNTPSEPVHCIVWAKHFFNQLFGEPDADEDEDISPDFQDPAAGKNHNMGNVQRVSTREWAKSRDYDPQMIFNKVFQEDIQYLIQMRDLWVNRKPPKPLDWEAAHQAMPGTSNSYDQDINSFNILSISEYADKFCSSLSALSNRSKASGYLSFDKDDDDALEFVTACSNLRSHVFEISLQSSFSVKSIAGNIVPAIAATNATISGLVVLQLLHVLRKNIEKWKMIYLNESVKSNKHFIAANEIFPPSKSCFICATSAPKVEVKVNTLTFTLRSLEQKILKDALHMMQPDVMFLGNIIITSDEDTRSDEDTLNKTLLEYGMKDESTLTVDDYLQLFTIILVIIPDEKLQGQEFEIMSGVGDLKPTEVLVTDDVKDSKPVYEDVDEIEEIPVEADDIVSEADLVAVNKPKEVMLQVDGPIKVMGKSPAVQEDTPPPKKAKTAAN